jgi:hypothetical protein
MPVGIDRHLNARVAHLLLDVVEGSAGSNQHGAECVPKVMETDRTDAGCLEQGKKAVPDHVVGVKYATCLGREDKILCDCRLACRKRLEKPFVLQLQ